MPTKAIAVTKTISAENPIFGATSSTQPWYLAFAEAISIDISISNKSFTYDVSPNHVPSLNSFNSLATLATCLTKDGISAKIIDETLHISSNTTMRFFEAPSDCGLLKALGLQNYYYPIEMLD